MKVIHIIGCVILNSNYKFIIKFFKLNKYKVVQNNEIMKSKKKQKQNSRRQQTGLE